MNSILHFVFRVLRSFILFCINIQVNQIRTFCGIPVVVPKRNNKVFERIEKQLLHGIKIGKDFYSVVYLPLITGDAHIWVPKGWERHFTERQLDAICWHEVGHRLNNHKGSNNWYRIAYEEMAADRYAVAQGCGQELIDTLEIAREKILNIGISIYFDPNRMNQLKLLQRRIIAIRRQMILQ